MIPLIYVLNSVAVKLHHFFNYKTPSIDEREKICLGNGQGSGCMKRLPERILNGTEILNGLRSTDDLTDFGVR